MSKINALMKETLQGSLAPTTCEGTMRKHQLLNRKRDFAGEHDLAGNHDLGLSSLQNFKT